MNPGDKVVAAVLGELRQYGEGSAYAIWRRLDDHGTSLFYHEVYEAVDVLLKQEKIRVCYAGYPPTYIAVSVYVRGPFGSKMEAEGFVAGVEYATSFMGEGHTGTTPQVVGEPYTDSDGEKWYVRVRCEPIMT